MHLFPLAASGFRRALTLPARSRHPQLQPGTDVRRVTWRAAKSDVAAAGSGAEPAPPDQAAQVLGRSAERGKVLRSSLDWLVDRQLPKKPNGVAVC